MNSFQIRKGPVKNLKKSMEFFSKLGFSFNAQFTDDTAACMIVSDDIYLMLLTHPKFKTFTPREICDTAKNTEVFVCLSSASRNEVDVDGQMDHQRVKARRCPVKAFQSGCQT